MSEKTHVQYGCAFTAPAAWLNFDASMTLRWERTLIVGRMYTKNVQRFPPNVRRGDIVKGLPVEDGSCKGVYASHVLEHLALEDFHKALEHSKQILAPDGVFRFVVPDLAWAAKEYVKRIQTGDPKANDFFLRQTSLGEEKRAQGLSGLIFKVLNKSRHLWMWDELSLSKALSDHGFHHIRRCCFGDGDDPMFKLVENAGRFENAVAMEARR